MMKEKTMMTNVARLWVRRARAKQGGVCFRSPGLQATTEDPCFGIYHQYLRQGGETCRLPPLSVVEGDH